MEFGSENLGKLLNGVERLGHEIVLFNPEGR